MSDETTTKAIYGTLIAAITVLYGFFLKHVIGHVGKGVQYKDNCEQIVKRLDEKFDQLNKKLDLILGHVEK